MTEIADLCHVTASAISQRITKLERPAIASASPVVQQASSTLWDTKKALEENYAGLQKMLDNSALNEVHIRAEIRQHIKLSMDVLMTLYSVQEIQAFQEEVLTVLDECEPGLRTRILDRIRQRRTLRSAFTAG